MKTYKYTDSTNNVVHIIDEDGVSRSSCLASVLEQGTVVLPADPVPVVYPPVSPRQIRQALTQAGLRSQVEAAIAAGDADLQDWWQYATEFQREHPVVVAMGQSLGQTDEQMNQLWQLAASL